MAGGGYFCFNFPGAAFGGRNLLIFKGGTTWIFEILAKIPPLLAETSFFKGGILARGGRGISASISPDIIL